jgi:prepilin-type N-terminal cleavage/methylation domain-containing protein
MSRSRGTGALLPPSPNASRQAGGIRKPFPPAGKGRVRRRLRSGHGPDFGVRSRSRGFTVVELVVVVTIIAILTAITLPMGINWITEYRFSMAARSLSNAVLMARMRGIENRAVFTITASATTTSTPFSAACPGIEFTTNMDHGLTKPNPVVANALVLPPPLPAIWSPVVNCRCVKNLAVATPPPTPGDMVMFSGLNHTKSMNGAEFEVLTVTAPNKFAVQHAVSATLGDTAGPDTTGTVRNLVAPGRLRIVPAVATFTPDPLNDNQESFKASAYTVKEEGSSIVFRYDTDKFEVTFYPGNPQDPAPVPAMDPSSAANKYAEIRFDNRGFPNTTMAFDGTAMATKAITTNTTIRIAEKLSSSVKKAPRYAQYMISPTGKVNTLAWEN